MQLILLKLLILMAVVVVGQCTGCLSTGVGGARAPALTRLLPALDLTLAAGEGSLPYHPPSDPTTAQRSHLKMTPLMWCGGIPNHPLDGKEVYYNIQKFSKEVLTNISLLGSLHPSD